MSFGDGFLDSKGSRGVVTTQLFAADEHAPCNLVC
jgi:hypothetical protein